jgi:sigma-E factor negative regulatory protein RseA
MTDSMLPNEALQSQLSAFVDDELPQAETDLFVRRLVKEADLKQTMGRYGLIGEALRAPTLRSHLSRDFSARIAAALDEQQDAAVTAPVTKTRGAAIVHWLKPVAGVAVAASVAWVAVLTVRNPPVVANASSVSAEVLQPVTLTAQQRSASADSYVVPAAASAPSVPIPTARLTNYVVAHSEFSSPLGRRNMMTSLLAEDQPAAEVAAAPEPASAR